MKEIWKDISGYEGIYQVSNCGRVKSLIRKQQFKDGRVYIFPEKILSPKQHKDGYLQVQLYNNARKKYRLIHRLVAEAFIGPSDNKLVLHGENGIQDNSAENLRHGSQSDNMLDAGRRDFTNGIPVIRSDGVEFPTCIIAAESIGVSTTALNNCLRGRSKSCGGFSWRYKNEETLD